MQIDENILVSSDYIKDLELSQLRLFKDGDIDWFVLVPRINDAINWHDLSQKEQNQLNNEINYVCRLLEKYSKPDKINVANLGNIVSQMHVHVIARYKNDRAWPSAIWGTQSKKNYQNFMAQVWMKRIQ